MKQIMPTDWEIANACKLGPHVSIAWFEKNYMLSRKTILRMIARREIKAHKIAGSIRIPTSELVRAIKEVELFEENA